MLPSASFSVSCQVITKNQDVRLRCRNITTGLASGSRTNLRNVNLGESVDQWWIFWVSFPMFSGSRSAQRGENKVGKQRLHPRVSNDPRTKQGPTNSQTTHPSQVPTDWHWTPVQFMPSYPPNASQPPSPPTLPSREDCYLLLPLMLETASSGFMPSLHCG